MKKLLFLVLCNLSAWESYSQDNPGQPIPELLAKLKKTGNTTARLDLLLIIADSYILKPGEERNDLDSALLLVQQVQKESSGDSKRTGVCYLLTSKALREKGFNDSARIAGQHAVDILGSLGPSPDWAYACDELANTYDIANIHEDSIRISLYQKAIPVFESTGRKSMLAYTLEMLGDCIGHLNSAESIPVLLKALEVYRSQDKGGDLRNLYDLLGLNYYNSGDPTHAIYYGLEAIREEERRHQPDPGTVASYNRLGLLYFTQGNLKEAIAFMGKGRDLSLRLDTAETHMLTYSLVRYLLADGQLDTAGRILREIVKIHPATTIVDQLFLNGDLCEYYLFRHRPDSARQYADILMHLSAGLPLDNGMQKVPFSALMDFGLATHQYDMVKKYGHDMLLYSRHRDDHIVEYNALLKLSRADSAMGDFKTAIAEYQSYIRIRDSLRTAENAKQVAALNIQYETEKKDKDIQALTHKQQLDAADLRQSGLIRNFTIVGSALLMVLLIVSVNRYRLKQRTNRQLGHLLTEKEWLVKEIHHRVKNNLHMISGLLDSQAGYLTTDEAVAAMQDSQHRVDAMSLIHQRLYQTNNLSNTDMAAFVNEFVAYLGASYNCHPRIRFIVEVERLEFGLTHAIPLGLILNEAVTNAIKYAFPDGRQGEITIKLQLRPDRKFLLSIADNGIGLGPARPKEARGSMGMSLIRGLSEDIGGELSIDGNHGTRIEIIFEYGRSAV